MFKLCPIGSSGVMARRCPECRTDCHDRLGRCGACGASLLGAEERRRWDNGSFLTLSSLYWVDLSQLRWGTNCTRGTSEPEWPAIPSFRAAQSVDPDDLASRIEAPTRPTMVDIGPITPSVVSAVLDQRRRKPDATWRLRVKRICCGLAPACLLRSAIRL